MADLDKLTDELAGKAALATGMKVAKRALSDALLSDEERAARDAEEAKAKKGQQTKWIVYGVIGLLLVVGLIGLAVAYWYWFLLAGLAALGVLYGRHRWRKRREARGEIAPATDEDAELREEIELPRTSSRREAVRSAPASSRAEPAEPPAPRKPTAEEAEAEAEAVDAELAAMKARLKK